MIINIPISFDDKAIEKKVYEEANKILEKEIENRVVETLEKLDPNCWDRRASKGMEALVTKAVREVIEKEMSDMDKDVVIDKAASDLAMRLTRTKKVKERVGEVIQNGK